MKTVRVDFPKPVQQLIAKRAGYRCAFPGCNQLLVCPTETGGIANMGECAHIYSASKKGPRGQFNLTEKELQSQENGIFLCSKHHTLIDTNEGSDYSALQLRNFKEFHEYLNSIDAGKQQYPLTWIKSATYLDSKYIEENRKFEFTKSTLLCGRNGTGKSTLAENLFSALSENSIQRWKDKDFVLRIEFSNPILGYFDYHSENGRRYYVRDGKRTLFSPVKFDVFLLQTGYISWNENNSDILDIASWINRDVSFVETLLCNDYLKDSAFFKEVRFADEKDDDGQIRTNLYVVRKDADGESEWLFNQLSGTHQSFLILDLLIAYLSDLSSYRNVMLIFDWTHFYSMDNDHKTYLIDKLQKYSTRFQTIMTSHSLFELKWKNWGIVELKGK